MTQLGREIRDAETVGRILLLVTRLYFVGFMGLNLWTFLKAIGP